MRNYSKQLIRNAITRLFTAARIPEHISIPVIDGLIETSLRGVDSHGIRLVPHYLRAVRSGRINIRPAFSFKKTSPTTGILDADHTFGITAGVFAMKKAIALAKRSGAGTVGAKHSSHFAAASIYSLLAARNDMIGISFTHSDALVAPFGGRNPVLGTNPLCFAAPCAGEDPFCLDMATSTVTINKILLHQGEKKPLEDGWAVNERGVPTLDAFNVHALTPMGAYKGYGLALMVEIFSSLLTGMPYANNIHHMYPLDNKKRNIGHFFIAIDIKRFQPINVFKKRLKILVTLLRNNPPAEGFSRILVAGDPEKETYAYRMKHGIPLPESVRSDFRKVAAELGVRIDF